MGLEVVKDMSRKTGIVVDRSSRRCGINTADVLRAVNATVLLRGVNFNIYIIHLTLLLVPESRTMLLI